MASNPGFSFARYFSSDAGSSDAEKQETIVTSTVAKGCDEAPADTRPPSLHFQP